MYLCNMANTIRMKYDAKLSLKANAEKCGVSISTMRVWLRQNNIDRHFDSMYAKFTVIKKLQKRGMTPQKISEKTGYSLNTVKKYMRMESFESKVRQKLLSIFDTSREGNIIKSVSDNQHEILNNILKLHVPTGIYDADFTFSIGNFYKNGVVPMPRLKFDKYSDNAANGVMPLEDAEKIEENSLNSCVVDLPFLITKKQWTANSIIAQRFNTFDSIDEARQANKYIMELSHRKLRKKGIMVYKTMDIYTEGRQIWMSRYVQEWAEHIGFKLIDTFILIAPNKVLSHGMNQRVSRKYHSYFFVFKKE